MQESRLRGDVGKVGREAETRGTEARRSLPDGCPVLDLDDYVPALLTFLANKLSRSASAFYRRHFGVGVTEWRLMSMLAVEPWIPASRICQVIGFDKGPVSRGLSFLERRGLVDTRTDGADARRRLSALTPAGRALHDQIIAVALERERRLLSCITPGQRAHLVELLLLLHDNVGAVNRPMAVPPNSEPRDAATRPRRSRRTPDAGAP